MTADTYAQESSQINKLTFYLKKLETTEKF